MVDSTFYKSTIKSNCILLSCHVRVRSSRQEVFCKKGALRNSTKFIGKHLCQSLFFNKVAGLRPATLLKKRLWHRCFLVNVAKFLRTPFLTEHLWRLLLAFQSESTICSFGTSSSKQVQYLKFKWTITLRKYSHSNKAQISSLCYVAGF